jgi:hypothetical protein
LFTSKKHDISGRKLKENKFAPTHLANLLEIYPVLTSEKKTMRKLSKNSQKAFQNKFATSIFFGRNPCRKKAGLGEENLRREQEKMSFMKIITFC